jgi:type VI secretion system protein VasG
VIDILLRRRQNNPLLTGDAGVGKTAVVEGLAQRIVAHNVPASLRDVTVRVLDLGLLQAGAAAKGEFEARLRAVIEGAQSTQPPVVLFIDEAHTLIGAGGAAGTGDAANLLKPALARGTLRTIAATTWAEYKRHFEKDPALARRFQAVSIVEPDEAHALAMLRAVAPAMESHHGVQVDDEALRAAVALSHRYINDRQLRDKAVSLLDTACARVAASRAAAPPALDHARERIATLAAEHALLAREHALGRCASARLEEARRALAAERERAALLETRWRDEARRVDAVVSARAALCEAEPADERASSEQDAASTENDGRRAVLARLERSLRERQGEAAFVAASVDREAVASVVQDWTGIPVRRMLRDEVEGVLALAERLDVGLVGQSHETLRLAHLLWTARAGLQRPERPLGVFLLAGPSGVGKTETARALADALYGGERNLITFNMSEFQESHAISTLKGAPPGYVGYGEGGVLTEAVRRKPYCVVLLDEIDKAHHDVHSLFYQVFDKGLMEDGQGRMVDFRNTVILLTTNRGDDTIAHAWNGAGGDDRAALDALQAPLDQALRAVFPAALLARMTIIPYLPLSDRSMRAIVRALLDRVRDQVATHHRVVLDYDEAVVSAIVERCARGEGGGGARLVDAVIADALLPELGYALLGQRGEQAAIERIALRIDDGAFRCRIER